MSIDPEQAVQNQSREKRVIGFTEMKEKYLPHRYPIIGLDRITDYRPGEYVEAVKAISGNSPEVVGHFPERAIYPGTTGLSSVAQLAIVFFKLSNGPLAAGEMTVIKSIAGQFLQPIAPGVLLSFRMTVRRLTSGVGMFRCAASVDGQVVMRSTVTLAKTKIDNYRDIPW